MHRKESAKKLFDFQATKMLILRQPRVPLFHLVQSLALVNVLQKILAVFFSINFVLLRSLW